MFFDDDSSFHYLASQFQCKKNYKRLQSNLKLLDLLAFAFNINIKLIYWYEQFRLQGISYILSD